MMKKKLLIVFVLVVAVLLAAGCKHTESSDSKQNREQENILQEATAQTGMPAIKNFRERKLLKQILELRDQEGVLTYTYIVAEQTGKLVFLGETIGYGIPAATQYTNPQKYVNQGTTLPQADPNGLFSPESAEGTWIMLKDPKGKEVRPVYVEPRIIVSPFRLD